MVVVVMFMAMVVVVVISVIVVVAHEVLPYPGAAAMPEMVCKVDVFDRSRPAFFDPEAGRFFLYASEYLEQLRLIKRNMMKSLDFQIMILARQSEEGVWSYFDER